MATSGFTEERCIGTVTGYSSFVQPLEGREGIRKFGFNFHLDADPNQKSIENSENYGKVLMFETMVGSKDNPALTDKQKARIMKAFEALGYDPKLPLMSPAQQKIIIGAKARVLVQKNKGGHFEIAFVDPMDAPGREGGGYNPFQHKMPQQEEEDFLIALEAFAKEKAGVTVAPTQPTGRTAAPARTAAAAPRTAAAAPRTAAAAPARAPAQRPQRQPNPDVDSGSDDGDQDIPF